ncbi:acyl carrier protein [Kitasatospora sp. NPDC002227]|uniref:acyl carrier protein n=1 Tax=Kitasatospora sp. NPDC002227 TaxID=3154773 RepID=UPI00332412F3
MISTGDFIRIVRDELDLPLASADLERDFDQVVHWDSMHMIRLVAVLERETGRRLPIGKLLMQRSLRDVYELVSAPAAA